MNIKDFAKSISGREYGYPQFTKEEIETAKENGFVIVYGYSDDNMKFDGSIEDEAGYCFDGGKVHFNQKGVCYTGDEENYPNCITALWCEEEENGKPICWTYKTNIPHETFMIYEDGEPYCKGIVFSIDAVKEGRRYEDFIA